LSQMSPVGLHAGTPGDRASANSSRICPARRNAGPGVGPKPACDWTTGMERSTGTGMSVPPGLVLTGSPGPLPLRVAPGGHLA
jgi:hypothetical protein